MNVKEAVSKAKDSILDIFGSESLSHITLEEVDFHDVDRSWEITVGVTRPSSVPCNTALTMLLPEYERLYKVVRISDDDQKLISIKNRDVPNAA